MDKKLIYNSKMLRKHLESIRKARVSIIVAPTGYGKSVLVQQLKKELKNADFLIHQVKGNDLMYEWASFCDTIATVFPKCAEGLRTCFQHGVFDSAKAVNLMKHLKSHNHNTIFLVVDDFFKLIPALPVQILSSILQPKGEDVYLVLVGHPFHLPYGVVYDPYAVYWVGAYDLLLSLADIKEYFALNRCVPGLVDFEQIYEVTNGWPAAVNACLDQALTGEKPDVLAITRRLLSQVSLNRLQPHMLKILMALAFLDEYDKNAVSHFVEPDNLSSTFSTLRTIPLTHLDESTQGWKMHCTLREFLALYLVKSTEKDRRDVYISLSTYYMAIGRLKDAVGCLYQVKEYEQILSLDLKLLQFESCLGVPSQTIAFDIIENCPMDIKARHRLSVLRLTFLLFSMGNRAGYYIALNQIRELIDPESEPHMYGEWLVISTLQHLPNLEKMRQTVMEAASYLQSPYRAIAWEEPVFFGISSLWYLLYATPGKGDEIGDQLEAFLKEYEKISIGRGSGCDLLYRAELASMRCQYEKATAYVLSASILGESSRQPTVVFGVALLKARIALAKGDEDGLKEARKYLEDSVSLFAGIAHTAILQQIVQTTRNIIYSMMYEVGIFTQDNLLSFSGDLSDAILLKITAHTQVMEWMMLGRLDKAIGAMEAIVHQKNQMFSLVNTMLIYAGLAMYYYQAGDMDKALTCIKQSLEIAEKDNLQAMYVNHLNILNPLLARPELEIHEPFILALQKTAGMSNHSASFQSMKHTHASLSQLSPREMEVAALAAKGLRNNEIAQRLFVTESTVKKHMQTIFEKLKIDRRTSLVSLMNRPDS